MDSIWFLLIWNRTCTFSKTHWLYLLNIHRKAINGDRNSSLDTILLICVCTLVVSQLHNTFHAWRSVNEWFHLYLVKRRKTSSHPDSQAADNHPNGQVFKMWDFQSKIAATSSKQGGLLDIVERKSRRRINLLLAFKRSFWRHYATSLGTSWVLSESGWFENISHVSNAADFCLMRAQRITWRRGQGLQFFFISGVAITW